MNQCVVIETEAKDPERISSSVSISVDDGRWTYTIGPLAAVVIGVVVVVVALASSSSINRDVVSNRVVKVSQPVIIVLNGERSITTTSNR